MSKFQKSGSGKNSLKLPVRPLPAEQEWLEFENLVRQIEKTERELGPGLCVDALKNGSKIEPIQTPPEEDSSCAPLPHPPAESERKTHFDMPPSPPAVESARAETLSQVVNRSRQNGDAAALNSRCGEDPLSQASGNKFLEGEPSEDKSPSCRPIIRVLQRLK